MQEVLTVWDEGLRGSSDTDVAESCSTERRALITLDVGFANICRYPPEQFAGLIGLRLEKQIRRHVLAVFRQILRLLERELLEGRLWIVDEHAVRVTGGPELSP